jgi:hypothetical protein
MCEVLEIHRSTYYKYFNFKDPDYPDYAVMKETFNHHKKTLEYRRLNAVLREEYGWVINAKKVLKIMRKFGLREKYIRDVRPNYTKKRFIKNFQVDQIKHHFHQRGWVTDITVSHPLSKWPKSLPQCHS